MNTQSKSYESVDPAVDELGLAPVTDGPAAAMLLSAGIGSVVLGIMIILAELSPAANTWLGSFDPKLGVGPLAGKVLWSVVAYAVSLVALWGLWRNKDVNLKTISIVAYLLIGLGFLFTFPPFFVLFAA
ncbi:MAG: hypothetical protein IT431_18315 [Phycisphaerales bacterium]|nr:hypothetical protein [Phycisphaerales bacterium]